MALLVACFLLLHGAIHLLGVAKAFGLADLPQLSQPISPARGLIWLTAALLFAGAAVALVAWPRWWWALGAAAIALSSLAIALAWTDARFGLAANGLALACVVFGFLSVGPTSLAAQYDRDVATGVARATSLRRLLVREEDLAHLPAPVRRYLQVTGMVGQPRVTSVRVRMHGRIRSGRDAQWMPIVAEQYNFFDRPSRLFFLKASMFGVPVQGYHRYAEEAASMLVKAAALVPVAKGSGSEFTQAETVTLFNDMCLLAPATLIDPSIAWETVDDHTARATFTNAGHTIHAELSFDDAGELLNFVSDDRLQVGPDGQLVRLRWSTPTGPYRSFDGIRLSGSGAAHWHDEGGDYPYIELTFDEVAYNVDVTRDGARPSMLSAVHDRVGR